MSTFQNVAPIGRRRLTYLLLALAMAMAMLVPTLTDAAPADISAAQKFRDTFGLRADIDFVRGLATQAATEPWPVPLTAAENAEMGRRVAIQNGMAPLHAFGAANPDAFGGVWIDQSAGGVVEVQLIGDLNAHAATVHARAPQAAQVRLVEVDNTFAELTALTDTLDKDRDYLASLGTEAFEIIPDVRTNRVQLGLSVASEQIQAALDQRYGAGLVSTFVADLATLTACNSRNDCIGPPLRGGINTNWGCTTGFMAREDSVNRFMTAGHCANIGSTWTHNGGDIGTMRDDEYFNGSEADAATVGNISATYMSNYVYYTNTSSTLVLSKEGNNVDTVGQTVCMSGRVSLFTCGELYAKGFSISYGGGVTIYDQRSATYNVATGDSGAPVLAANKAMGIQSGVNTAGRGIYSHIYNVEQQLNATVYLGP
jgi:hypothetical protein